MFEALAKLLPDFEGRVPHMYLDTRGYPTTGVGHLLAAVKDAYGLPFLLPTGLAAALHDILNDYQAVKQSQPGKLPKYYAAIADLRLSDASIDALLMSDIQVISSGLITRLAELPTFPDPAQNALVNMAFQLGPHGVTAKYPRLMAACRAHDWKTAAAECFIPDAQKSRNDANKKFFLSI